MTIQSINPATEEVLATFEELDEAQVEDVIAVAHAKRRPGYWRHRK